MGLATTGLGTLLQMKAESDATDAKVSEAQQNQRLADARATDALQRGAYEAGALRMNAGRIAGQQRADFGASGVDENVGSAADVQASTRMMGELDARTAMNNAYRQAWGFKTYGYMYGQEAGYEQRAGQYAEAGTFLGGISQGEQQIASAGKMMAGGGL